NIHSDFDNGKGNLLYSLKGVGANINPFHVFVVNSVTGQIRLTQVLDREFISEYNLLGVATFTNGSLAEENIGIRFKVVDENDEAPVFGNIEPGEVDERSPKDTSVMKANASDADEPGNINSKIAYTLLSQSPPDDMFYMNTDGTIYVNKPLLDRETHDQYILRVKGQDLNGQPGGYSGTGTVTINVRDVNDNVPTLEREEYEGSIEENEYGVEVMRLKTTDLDLQNTENWEAVFDIITGNEAGYFSIKTDPKTNEGILMLDKVMSFNIDLKCFSTGGWICIKCRCWHTF
uniref:Desmoglein-2-like n=1 Tax=Gouania willdenowi TaxID=441366 RepID=A0A8C5DWK8_GOUWI